MLVGCLAFCATASAQYKVGEAFVKDGVPCIIIDVDASGQHGLAMSLQPTYKAMKDAKKTGNWEWYCKPTKLKGKDKKLKTEYLSEFYNRYKCDSIRIRTSGMSTAERPITSRSGRENMDNLMAFCDEKGIAMEVYFPEFHWAQTLGKDWFIPGADELELYVKLIGYNSFGFNNAIGAFKYAKTPMIQNAFTTYATTYNALEYQPNTSNATWFSLAAIASSTITKDGNQATPLMLLKMYQKITMKYWYDLVKYYNTGYHPCAVCKF